MIAVSSLQPEHTAKLLRSFGQALLGGAGQSCPVVCHDYHPQLYGCPPLAFVGQVPCAAAEQTGDETFHDRPAVSTGTGKARRGGGAGALPPCFAPESTDLCGRRHRGARRDRAWDAHGENPPALQRLPQLNARAG